jgi:hypothetical protein
MHAACWQGTHLEDVAAFIEKASGFRRGEFPGITQESLDNSLSYQYNLLMVLGRMMGYQMADGVTVMAGLTEFETVYQGTLIARLVHGYRRNAAMSLEDLCTRISAKLAPLYSQFKGLCAIHRQDLTGHRIQEQIWATEGNALYTLLLESPVTELYALPINKLSLALTKREPAVLRAEAEEEGA